MSDKIRIHELAKKYGLTGKDCAAKLRDFGFSKARSHMTALDEFEAMQASGLLEANGIPPVAGGEAGDEGNVGGVKVKKKLKKRTADDAGEPSPEPVAADEPEPAPVIEEVIAEAEWVARDARYTNGLTIALPAIELVTTDLQDQLRSRRALLPTDYLNPTDSAYGKSGLPARAELPIRVRFQSQRPTANYRVLIFYP